MQRHGFGALVALLTIQLGCSDDDPILETERAVPPLIHTADIPANVAALLSDQAYRSDCLREVYYHCPDRSAIWRAKALVDTCTDTVLTMSECEEVLECRPQADALATQTCVTENGVLGRQEVFCPKGEFVYGPCVPCETAERCDLLDNDCDGETDEGVFECESHCGVGEALCLDGELTACDAPEPSEEICNYVDDDCDGLVDEYQRNACDQCGPVPDEKCDGEDNDCDGDIDEDLVDSCQTVCGSGAAICAGGSWHCTAPKPKAEACNGIDDDCDGQVDEGLSCGCSEPLLGALLPCATDPLVCGQGWSRCECETDECTNLIMTPCQAMCAYDPGGPGPDCDPTLGAPTLELCNDFDDDCDEAIDEDLFAVCYTGPPGTQGIGICQEGEAICQHGQWGWDLDGEFVPGLCNDEVLPQETDHCNGADDDCDGVADSGKTLEPTDIVFVLDWSGSMAAEINAVVEALSMFAVHYSDETVIRWGLVLVANSIAQNGPDQLKLSCQPMEFTSFFSAINALNPWTASGADEMTLDALYLLSANLAAPENLGAMQWSGVAESEPALHDFLLEWGEDSEHVVILFTDEEPQSFLEPALTPDSVAAALTAADVSFYAFSPSSLKDEWAPLVTKSWFQLTSDPVKMLDQLLQVLDETACSDD